MTTRTATNRWSNVPTAVLLGLSALATLSCLIPIPTESLWPIRMVAREVSPWFVAINLLGVAATVGRRRAAVAVFAAGLAVATWPLFQLSRTRAEIMRQWPQQGFVSRLHVPGTIEVLTQSALGLTVPTLEPRVLSSAIHLYRPTRRDDEPLPTIIDIHGGSWQVGGVRDDESFSRIMAAKGFAVFALDYRKAPAFKFPAQRDDVMKAIVWVRDNALRLGADPERVALVGRSAGGHLAMLAAYARSSVHVRSVISFYGPADLRALYAEPPSPDPLHVRTKLEEFLGGTPDSVPQVYREASPVSLVGPNLPPTLHIQGGGDNVVPVRLTRALHAALLAAGSRSLLLEIPWADHSFNMVHFGPSNVVAQSVIDAFLADTLRVP